MTAKLNAPARDGNGNDIPLPSDFERHIVMFAHADMCALYSYNSGLSSRRADAVKLVLPSAAPGVLKNVSLLR